MTKRAKTIAVRLTEQEYQTLQQAAQRLAQPLAQWARFVLLTRVRVPELELGREGERLAELDRMAEIRDTTEEIERLFDDPDWCARVRARSHPNQWRQQQGETLLDSFYYRYDVSGPSGRARLLKEMLRYTTEGPELRDTTEGRR